MKRTYTKNSVTYTYTTHHHTRRKHVRQIALQWKMSVTFESLDIPSFHILFSILQEFHNFRRLVGLVNLIESCFSFFLSWECCNISDWSALFIWLIFVKYLFLGTGRHSRQPQARSHETHRKLKNYVLRKRRVRGLRAKPDNREFIFY